MSQPARQDLADKAGSILNPDSTKTTAESTTDSIKGKIDGALSALQPEDSKTTTQKAGDAISNGGQDQSVLEKALNTVGLSGNK